MCAGGWRIWRAPKMSDVKRTADSSEYLKNALLQNINARIDIKLQLKHRRKCSL